MSDTNAPSSTRKRAIIACDFCRKRKRRCDGRQPICSLCLQSHRTICDYGISLPVQAEARTGASLDIVGPDSPLTSRLTRLDAVMAEHSDAINAIKDKLRNLEDSTSRPGNASLTAYDTPATPVQLVNPSPGGSTFSRFNELMPMPIPIAHGSTSEDLLRSRQLKALLGDYPKDMLLRREQKRKQPEEFAPRKDTLADQLALPLDTSCTAELVNIYFAVVNPRHPVLEQETFDVTDNSTDVPGAAGTKIALVLMVLTLASISQASPQVMKDGVSPGIEFARPAIQFLFRVWPSYCETDMELCQALYLAASWYNYLCRPLQAWRMIHMASTNIQHVFLQYESQEVEVSQNLVRLCWAIFLMECDILAEYHLPRSGIENVVERIPYPKCGPNPDLHVLAWLANLSARRLMNCVHFTVYNTASSDLNNCHGHILDSLLDSANANVLIGISAELNHQLYLWWDLLPQPIKPEPDDLDPDAHQGDLMLRFWACGDIIFRPFLYKVCSMPQGWIPEEALIEPAMSCINHCRKFLRLVSSLTRVPSPFTLINLHSTLAVIINLTVASLCPFLVEYVSDIEELETLAVSILEKWACKGSSIEIMLQIARSLSSKRQTVGTFN